MSAARTQAGPNWNAISCQRKFCYSDVITAAMDNALLTLKSLNRRKRQEREQKKRSTSTTPSKPPEGGILSSNGPSSMRTCLVSPVTCRACVLNSAFSHSVTGCRRFVRRPSAYDETGYNRQSWSVPGPIEPWWGRAGPALHSRARLAPCWPPAA